MASTSPVFLTGGTDILGRCLPALAANCACSSTIRMSIRGSGTIPAPSSRATSITPQPSSRTWKAVAWAIVSALYHGRLNAIYNIRGEPITHNEANAVISHEAGITPFRLNVPSGGMLALAQVRTWFAHVTRREPYYPSNLRHYVFNGWPTSTATARQELGFSPIPSKQGVWQTLVWHRASGARHGRLPLLGV